jgi:hypothetical protein
MRPLAIVSAAAALVVVGCVGGPHVALWYWDHLLAKSLPSGSKLDRAISFFNAEQLSPSYDPRSNTLYALTGEVGAWFPVTYRIEIRCKFDVAGALSNCAAGLVGDGP